MQLMVEKCDGSREVYLHTKVMGSIALALGDCGNYHEGLAEQLAESVTTFLRRRYGKLTVSADEIHAMIAAVLSETAYEQAALALQENRIGRQIKRSRREVVHCDAASNDDIVKYADYLLEGGPVEPWNKSVIVRKLEDGNGLPHNLARAVAAGVEEKVLGLGCRRLFSSLVRELVVNELVAMKQAEMALLTEDSCKDQAALAAV